jgi:hypothetical protein
MENEFTKPNLKLFCDIEIFLGLAWILLILECLLNVFKFVQTCDVFICDLIIAIKSFEKVIY